MELSLLTQIATGNWITYLQEKPLDLSVLKLNTSFSIVKESFKKRKYKF